MDQQKINELMQAASEEQHVQEHIQTLEEHLRAHMSKDAFLRYANIKTANKDQATRILVLMNRALETGKIDHIDDENFKEVLRKINQSKTFNIKRK